MVRRLALRSLSTPSRAAAAVALAALLGALTGCDAGRDEAPPTAAPILVVAVDGLEWDVLLPLLNGGDLPHLAALMERGSYGYLQTFEPTSSPIIWTTIATGKPPAQHGIGNFAWRDGQGRLRLYTNADRRTKALWNILTDHELTTTCVGWWMTWPVDAIRGVMVAQTNTIDQLDVSAARHVWKGSLIAGVPGQVHPPAEQNAVLAVLAESERTLNERIGDIFGRFAHPLREFERRLWENCRWAFRADATYLEVTLELLRRHGAGDLTMVYFGGPDVVGHRFWRYLYPDRFAHPPAPADVENFGDVIPDYYRYVDQAIGLLVAACPADVTVLVVSDHGMKSENLEADFPADDPPSNANSAHHHEAPPGVIIAAGPHVERAQRSAGRALSRVDLPVLGSVFDVTPTLLAWLRLPRGLDMPGRVLTELTVPAFDVERQPAAVRTHDTPAFLANRPRPDQVRAGEADRLGQLRDLGYVGDD